MTDCSNTTKKTEGNPATIIALSWFYTYIKHYLLKKVSWFLKIIFFLAFSGFELILKELISNVCKNLDFKIQGF